MDIIDTPPLKAVTPVSSRLDGLIMPVDTEHPLFKALWFKFQSKKFAKYQDKTTKVWVYNTNRFVRFLESKGYTSIENTPITVFNEWGKSLNIKTAYDVVSPFKSAADEYFCEKMSELGVDEFDFLSGVIKEFSIQRRASDKKLPLSMMFAKCPFADDELYISLRLVCANLILLEQQAKDSILSQESCKHYQEFDCDSVSKEEYVHSFSSINQESRTLMCPVFEAITKGNNEYAKEWILQEILSNPYRNGSQHSVKLKKEFDNTLNTGNVNELYAELLAYKENRLAKSRVSASDIEEIKEKLANARPSYRELAEKYGVRSRQVRYILEKGGAPRAVPHDVVTKIKTEYSKPTYSRKQAEREYGICYISLRCFLKNGLPEPEPIPYRLNIDSIGLWSNSWSSGCYGISNLTSINPLQQWAFGMLLATEGMQKTGFELLTFDDIKETESITGKQTIQFDHFKNRTGPEASLTVEANSTALHSNKDKPDTFYRAFSCATSQFRKSLKFRAASEREKLFTQSMKAFGVFLNHGVGKLLADRLLNSDSVLRRELEKEISKEQLEPFLWLLESFSKSTQRLPISPIHESFVLINAGNTTNPRHAEIAAGLSGHSKKTDEDYLARYPRIVKEKLSDTPSLSFRVAEMMASFADDINEMLPKTEVLSKVQVKELLGISHVSDTLNVDMGLLGEFESDQKTVYIATPSTAALILRRLDHLKAEIPRLIQHQRSDKRVVNDVVKEFIQLSDVLAKFPANMVAEGEKHTTKLPSTLFPPIV